MPMGEAGTRVLAPNAERAMHVSFLVIIDAGLSPVLLPVGVGRASHALLFAGGVLPTTEITNFIQADVSVLTLVLNLNEVAEGQPRMAVGRFQIAVRSVAVLLEIFSMVSIGTMGVAGVFISILVAVRNL